MQLSLEAIRGAVEQLHYEISTESRLVRVGLKAEQRIEPILQRYDWLTSRAVLDFLQEQLDGSGPAEERERLERLWLTCLGDFIYKKLSPLDDRLHTELARAEVRLNGSVVGYYNLQPMLQREPSFEKREAIGAAMDSVHVTFHPLRLEMLRQDLAILREDFRFPDYIGYCRRKKQFHYEPLVESLRAALARTEPLYGRHMARWCEQKLGRPFGNLNRYHVAYLMRLNEFDPFFPRAPMTDRLLGTLRALGIDLQALPNIRLDLEDRDRKNPRACCYAARVPGEVHLILKPVGGLTDYDTFLHEAGHALHYGHTDPALPLEYRKLGRSHALSEIYAFTLQNVVMNLPWLRRVMGLDERTARRLRYHLILKDLFLFRRYAAKLLAEHEFFQRGNLADGSIYARTLTAATGFVYVATNYLFDMDGELYNADYLRAWIGEAQLADHLEKRFGPDWTTRREAGQFLRELWKEGDKPSAEEVISRTGRTPLDLSCLEARFGELDALAPTPA